MAKVKYCRQINETDCGLSCIVMLMSYYNSNISLSYLRDKINLGRDGMNVTQIIKLLLGEGISSKVINNQEYGQLEYGVPVIGLDVESNHFSVIQRKSGKKYRVYDPAVGKYSLDITGLVEKFSYFLLPSLDSHFVRKNIKENQWEYFLEPLKINKLKLLQLLFFSLIVYVTTISVTFMIQNTIDNLNGGDSHLYLKIAVTISIVYLIASYIRNLIFIKLEVELDKHLNFSLFSKILALPFTFFNSRGESEILYRVSLLTSIRSLISNGIVNLVLDGGTCFALLIYLYILNYNYGVIITVLSIGTYMYISSINKKILVINQKIMDKQSSLLQIQIELIKNLEYLKTTAKENNILKKFETQLNSFISNFQRGEGLSFLNSLVLDFLSLMAPLIILYISIYIGLLDNNTVGEKVTLYFISSTLIGKQTSLFQNVTSFELIRNILTRINDIYSTKSEVQNMNSDSVDYIKKIEFRDVSFRYSDNAKNVLSNINFEINRGEKIAFVGESGSGKSTVLKLLSRLYEPIDGEVLVNGQALDLLNLLSYRSKISYIPQDAELMDDTIYSNLTLDGDCDSDQILQSLKNAQLEQDIESFPLGLNTKVSAISKNISGGQKQRIAIARAMLYQGDILISDEGTSSLDFITENKISMKLDEIFSTQILVAHRLSTIKNSNIIYFP